MSCVSFLSASQRAALAGSSRADSAGAPLSAFSSPSVSEGKIQRIRALSRSDRTQIRQSAALARHAPEDVLAVLATDPASSVRCCVARNEHTGQELLRLLAGDSEAAVRGWVAANRNTPAGLLRALADDPDPGVRAVAAWAARW
jgi:hypothetical protein